MFTVAFLRAAAERAGKTFAQTAAALIVAGLNAVDLIHLEYRQIGLAALTAAVLSVLTSVGTASKVAPAPEDEPLPATELGPEPAAPVADEPALDTGVHEDA